MTKPWEHSNFWTEDRTKLLVKLVGEGRTYSQIGDVIGCTRNAALGKFARLGLARPAKATKPGAQVAALRAPPVRRAPHENAGLAFGSRKSAKQAPDDAAGPDLRQIHPPQPPKAHAAGARAKVLADLGARECKWGVGPDPGRGNSERQLFCCEPAPLGAPYCDAHARVAVQKHRTPEQREADDARMAKMRAAKGCKPNQNTAFFANRGGKAA